MPIRMPVKAGQKRAGQNAERNRQSQFGGQKGAGKGPDTHKPGTAQGELSRGQGDINAHPEQNIDEDKRGDLQMIGINQCFYPDKKSTNAFSLLPFGLRQGLSEKALGPD